jgi:16S rRNA (cytidine1402-2'-O)-methyltransferase
VHEHNERARVERIVSQLRERAVGRARYRRWDPGISDPGAALVAAIRGAGFRVEPIPGASAVAAAISAAGVSSPGFTFLGFPPIRLKDRKIWFEQLSEASKHRLVVFFEAPHKVRRTLEDLILLVKRRIIIGREITKVHEEFVSGTPSELLARVDAPQSGSPSLCRQWIQPTKPRSRLRTIR